MSACGSNQDPMQPVMGSGGSPPTWGDQCGQCALDDQCATAKAGCEAEVECVSFLACVVDCPVGAEGGVDEACLQSCPVPSGSIALSAKTELERCIGSDWVSVNCAGGCGPAAAGQGHPCYRHDCLVPAPSDSPCVDCLKANCCGVRDAWLASAEAQALHDCYLNCVDATCMVACDGMHPGGLQAEAEVLSCASVRCPEVCADAPLEPCMQCVQTACEYEYGEKMCSADGWAATNCIAACADDLQCETACYTQYPSIMAPSEALVQCIASDCSGVCGV